MRRKKAANLFVTGTTLCISLLLILGLSGPVGEVALAQELIIYPSNGQTPEQQEKDEFDCYKWAKGQSGFDPMEVPKATAPPPQEEAKVGGVGRGAARGAVTGLAVGAIAGDAGKGAAIGAAGGGLIGGARRRDQRAREEKKKEQWAQEQAANYQRNRSNYNRAYSACLEGRGYTVK
jgi:hypothetical protein